MQKAFSSSGSSNLDFDPRLLSILRRLAKVDTAAICDADKSVNTEEKPCIGRIRLMNENMVARNMNNLSDETSSKKIVGVARTVQLTNPNDFLAVLQGLDEAKAGEVLCINTKESTKAVAGGLFCQEAERKELAGLIIDGPVRDLRSMQQADVLCYSTSVTPYSGTIKSVGVMQAKTIKCGGADVSPGDIVFGDCDGVVVGSIDIMEKIIDSAENIVSLERDITIAMREGQSLHSMTNYSSHLAKIKKGEDSSLEFTLGK
jgi:4-hydroxy-4-methyl-2-oxoglutarate aldolase